MKRLSIAGSLLAAACGGDVAETDARFLTGFTVPAPAKDEMQVLSPIVRNVMPGTDVLICSYLDVFVERESDVVKFSGFTSRGSHHAILYGSAFPHDVGSAPCKDEEMVGLSLIAGTGGDEAGDAEEPLPAGMVRRVHAGTQLMIQTHWLNIDTKPMDGQAAFNIELGPPKPGAIPTDFLAVMNTELEIPAKGTLHAETECVFDREINIWELSGHQHAMGAHVRIEHRPKDGEPKVLFDEDWQPAWSFNVRWNRYHPEPLVIRKGDTLHVACDWNNPSDDLVTFPHEMCGAIAQFYPSTSQLVCFNGRWL